jgi:hypothetical protein
MNHIDMHNDPLRYRDGELPEDSPSMVPVPYVHRALGSVSIDDIETRSDLIKELTKHIPLNEFGLPQYYYRPDLLDVQVVCGSMKRGEATFVDEILQSAIVPLWFTQGFPSIGDDLPIWGCLPFESKEAHAAFLQYAELEGIRSLHMVTAFPPEQLREWFHLYYWTSRAKALDMFKTAHHARLREQRIMQLEDTHWVEGEKIFRKIAAAIGNKSQEDLDKMEIDKLISSLEKVSKIQRGAVRADVIAKENETPRNTSVEVIMRQTAEAEGKIVESNEFDMDLLQDPDVLEKAQELIIKVNK